MAFLEFECFQTEGEQLIHPTGDKFRLAGYQLIYQAWELKGKLLDTGWHVSEDDLIRIHSADIHDTQTRRLIIDFDPNSKWRIGLVELLDIYAFTWSDGNGTPVWTPLMLRLRDVFNKEYDTPLISSKKDEILSRIPEPKSDTPDFVEFLYLNGAANGWKWGKNGMTNAVFLQGKARGYFRQFF